MNLYKTSLEKKPTLLNPKIFGRCGMNNIDKSTGQEKVVIIVCGI